MYLVKRETPMTFASGIESPVRLFLAACGTCALNIVERFHEYADGRLAEELTIVEQRKRLLNARKERPTPIHQVGARAASTPRLRSA